MMLTLARRVIKFLGKGDIVAKEFRYYEKKLYYERSQHLTFLFSCKIKYEENVQKKLRYYIKEGDLVFDIGGNIGQYALPFSELVGDTGRVISFEPDYKNFAFLQFNININKCTNVTCCNYAIGADETALDFYRDTKTGGRMGSFNKENVNENFDGFSEKVFLKKFDSIISVYGQPSFVKIDVEGFEHKVIAGLTLNFQHCVFLVEVREETKHDVFSFFNEKGYRCIWVDGDDKFINKVDEIPGYANLLFKYGNG